MVGSDVMVRAVWLVLSLDYWIGDGFGIAGNYSRVNLVCALLLLLMMWFGLLRAGV
jgi:hypothetical protein